MENKKMYVITMSRGSYDSYYVSIVAITDDLVKGKAYVNKMNQTFESMETKVKNVFELAERDWLTSNPRPDYAAKGLMDIPKWKSGQTITQEMRNERKKIELKNQAIVRKFQEPLQEWFKQLTQFREDWTKEHLTEIEQEVFKIRDENTWEIEEANWL